MDIGGPRRDYEGKKIVGILVNVSTSTPLSCRATEIILGSLLGDGSLKIHKPYKNARFSFRHSISQREYFFWKVKALEEISSKKCVWVQEKGGQDGFGEPKLRYQSRAIDSLADLYTLTHKRGRFEIRRKWLNQLTPLSLVTWWCDDGSLVANSRKGVFCTDGFPKKEVQRLRQYLKVVWRITTHLGAVASRSEREYYRLWIYSTEELKKFLRIILPCLPVASMLPKVLLMYRDSQLQQRWISEVCELSPFPRSVIEEHLLLKRSKWKHFRE